MSPGRYDEKEFEFFFEIVYSCISTVSTLARGALREKTTEARWLKRFIIKRPKAGSPTRHRSHIIRPGKCSV